MTSTLKNTKVKKVNLIKEVSNNNRKTNLYLALKLPPERLYIKGYRRVLGKFVKAVCTADPIVVIAQYKDNLETSKVKVCNSTCKCIDSIERVSESAMQM